MTRRVSLFVEPIPTEQELLQLVAEEDIAHVQKFAVGRRRESLAWRAIVRRELGKEVKIGYDSFGAPQVENVPQDGGANQYIGVSHCKDRVAVVIADVQCAVDIERIDRQADHLRDRYVSESEIALSDRKEWGIVAWCAKETLYKLHRVGCVSIKEDLKIVSVDFERGVMYGTILDKAPVEMTFSLKYDHCVVVACR